MTAVQYPNQILSQIPKYLQASLEDISTNLELGCELCIRHPNYQPWETSIDMKSRFQKLPWEVQQKHIAKHLRNFLYGVYYNGSLIKSLELQTNTAELVDNQRLNNDNLIGIDVSLFQQLHASNQGEGYFSPGWVVKKQEKDGTIAVNRGQLTVHINPEIHLKASEKSVAIGDIVAVKMPKNCVQEGFYIAVGNTGVVLVDEEDQNYRIVRIYFNITSDGAVPLMQALTQQLNEQKIYFSFKVPYSYSSYDRYDAGVLYIRQNDYLNIYQILQNIYNENQVYFQENIPLFTKYLAPGLGLAEEPDTKFEQQESFGTNRCQIVANGLLIAQQNNRRSPEEKLSIIIEQFARLNVDLRYPYLNPNSTDIYTPL
ncbi:T3SS effector HopA1 family protein [Anabaena sp. CCY 9402-a]|uniref:T3SS effector HopA1 family protein n=1 Tax=Anabaena sp. CCY 9402-a TaxID=3103867 RepID=UPI0039C728C1